MQIATLLPLALFCATAFFNSTEAVLKKGSKDISPSDVGKNDIKNIVFKAATSSEVAKIDKKHIRRLSSKQLNQILKAPECVRGLKRVEKRCAEKLVKKFASKIPLTLKVLKRIPAKARVHFNIKKAIMKNTGMPIPMLATLLGLAKNQLSHLDSTKLKSDLATGNCKKRVKAIYNSIRGQALFLSSHDEKIFKRRFAELKVSKSSSSSASSKSSGSSASSKSSGSSASSKSSSSSASSKSKSSSSSDTSGGHKSHHRHHHHHHHHHSSSAKEIARVLGRS